MVDRESLVTPIPDEASVVVVGGGLAGLAAARTLLRAGIDVRLLEAERRVGGRVLTVRSPFPDGLYAEAGGEFVDGGHQVLHDFLREYGLDLVPIPSGQRLFRFEGATMRGESLSDLSEQGRRDEERIAVETHKLAARIDDTLQPWRSAADLDRHSVGDWLDGLGLGRVARTYQQIWRTVDYGAAPERLSLLQYARDERLWQRAPDLVSGRVRGGMDRLPSAIAAEIGQRIVLGATVSSICQDADGITITMRQDGTISTLRARYGVLAIPPVAVRRLALDPPAPDASRPASGLKMGRITKVLLQVRRRFWEDHGVTGRAFTDGLVQATYETTAGQPGERAVLTIYTADSAADTLASLSDDERLSACLTELERLYPGCSREVERGVTMTWRDRPPVSGAYSHFRPGDLTRLGPCLAEPLGRLHFAGEHTDQWQATMNGALSSGLRAAGEILDRLG